MSREERSRQSRLLIKSPKARVCLNNRNSKVVWTQVVAVEVL